MTFLLAGHVLVEDLDIIIGEALREWFRLKPQLH